LGGLAYSAAYSASKHAQLGLTRSLALEVARFDIAVNAICPAWVDTDMLENAVMALVQKTGRTADEARADLLKLSGQTKAIEPAAVATETLRLASLPDAGTTGQAISMF
jgi:NAD(P)-dependent dehydrogenase (short-subunit alcohol dehydrogenase family)